jgi:hypothetical protein
MSAISGKGLGTRPDLPNTSLPRAWEPGAWSNGSWSGLLERQSRPTASMVTELNCYIVTTMLPAKALATMLRCTM